MSWRMGRKTLCGCFIAQFVMGLAWANAASVTVVNNADTGPGSLRGAITYANAHPSTIIAFSIPDKLLEKGVAAIRLKTPLPHLTADKTTIDGSTQRTQGTIPTGATPPIVLKRSLLGDEKPVSGLVISAAHCVVHKIAVNDFSGSGILLTGAKAHHNKVSGCYLGTSAQGIKPFPNQRGLLISNGAKANLIGGPTPKDRNVISGNAGNGIIIQGLGTSNNRVQGNYIGTDASGKAALPNGINGIELDTTQDNLIGGVSGGERNVIAANGWAGILMGEASKNRVQGNYIGTDMTGSKALGNHVTGINITTKSPHNIIGGTTPAARNVIAGNTEAGISIRDPGTHHNVVIGNYLGTDASGTKALGNEAGVVMHKGAQLNTVGGTEAGSRNIIAGNKFGVDIHDPNTIKNVVAGNYIGTDVSGTKALGNGHGVLIRADAQSNTIGGLVSQARNIISGNQDSGIALEGKQVATNLIEGNYIGTDPTGLKALGNDIGVALMDSAHANKVGGNAPGARNIIAGNRKVGVLIQQAHRNIIEGNYIGTDATGTGALGHTGSGIRLGNGAQSNKIGGTAPNAGNVIAFNLYGVMLNENETTGNSIRANSIFNNKVLGICLYAGRRELNGMMATQPPGGAPGPNHMVNYPIIVSAKVTENGVSITGILMGAEGKEYVLDFFSNPATQPIKVGEGQVYIGSTPVTMTGRNNTRFTCTFPGDFQGRTITATATHTESGDTSEFSAGKAAVE